MQISRPFREYHPAMKAGVFMLLASFTVFLHSFFLKQPPNLRILLKDFYLSRLRNLQNIVDFTLLDPLTEELAYRGPAYAVLLMCFFLGWWFKKELVFKKIGLATASVILVIFTFTWAKEHHYPVTVFLYGMIWGGLMLYTKNILYPILFHAGANTLACLGIMVGYHLIY